MQVVEFMIKTKTQEQQYIETKTKRQTTFYKYKLMNNKQINIASKVKRSMWMQVIELYIAGCNICLGALEQY